jgi:pimeloyl-ACP methyl ester carboxylesterase
MPEQVRFCEGPERQRIAYAIQGAGPALVCAAWWVSHLDRDWEDSRFRAFFATLAKQLTVVRYDRRGSGLSDRRRARFDLESEVADLAAVVDHLRLSRFALLAISCGGPPALAYAARHPERVERLALYGSYLRGADLGSEALRATLPELVRAH